MDAVLLRFFKDPRNDEIALQYFFFLSYSSARIFFLLHLCCMQFFSSDKRLQEIFFQNHPPPPPPPSRVKWSAPNYRKCVSNFLSFWLANRQWLFLTDQSWRILKPRYTGGRPEQRFRRCFADGLNQSLVLSGAQANHLSEHVWSVEFLSIHI